VAKLVLENLARTGKSYIANDDESQFYFYNPEKRLYRIGSPQFDALCCDLFGLNLSEQEFKFILAEIRVQVTRRAPRADLFRFARFGRPALRECCNNRVFRLDGDDRGRRQRHGRGPFMTRRSHPSNCPSPVRDRLSGEP
jgi:hypothetical protein